MRVFNVWLQLGLLKRVQELLQGVLEYVGRAVSPAEQRDCASG